MIIPSIILKEIFQHVPFFRKEIFVYLRKNIVQLYLYLDTVWRNTYSTAILFLDILAENWIIVEWFEHGNIDRVLGYRSWILAWLVPRYIELALREYFNLNTLRTAG